jgi:hypothetical protein
MDGAAPALRDAAAKFRSGQPDDVANCPEQGHLVGNVEIVLLAIDRK